MDGARANADVISEKRDRVENAGPGGLSSPQVQKKNTLEPLHKVFAMAKGDGDNSYSKNSNAQAELNKLVRSILNEALEIVTLPAKIGCGDRVVVADLGSSSSANSINNVARIVDKLRLRLPESVEFQVYFNDLPSNDFNQLFQILTFEDGAHNFFAAGVPGSFYSRLFPRSQVHVFHSSLCLHWMSKIPDAVLDKNSPAYNGGNIWYKHSRTAVAKAYKEQSSLDLRNFLRAREAELKPGGLLFFSFLSRPNSDPTDRSYGEGFGIFLMVANDILSGLVSEGLLDEEVRGRFNIPVYMRSMEEVNEAIESCGGAFRVLTAKMEPGDANETVAFPKPLRSIHTKNCFADLLATLREIGAETAQREPRYAAQGYNGYSESDQNVKDVSSGLIPTSYVVPKSTSSSESLGELR